LKFKSINFTCKNCGAPLRFNPLSNTLICEFCSTKESIEKSTEKIKEYSFEKALNFFKKHQTKESSRDVTCNKCSATFTLPPYLVSANCPYCDTPIITEFIKEIHPKSLLPFQVSQTQAQEFFKKWIGSLWFAPSELKQFIRGNNRLKGAYLPYWTYDSDTYTRYNGERGDVYYVEVEKTVIVNGREERRVERESRIHWSSVSGEVNNSFDDITIGASKTVSHTILDNLSPWHTDILLPFNKKYLSGFNSEEYTINLESGFEYAKIKMERVIRNTIKSNIGGDQQRINHFITNYNNTTYKSVLFPVWTAEFKWKKKNYNYAINGQTGKVTGERPYSWFKITLLILTLAILIGSAVYLADNPEFLNYINNFFY
jgi:hypothetical protein